MCQALPISVVSIIPHPIISTNTNNFPKLETLLFVPLFHIALFYWFVHLEDLLQKQIFQKMLHTLHKSLSADRRDWKLFNYYSLKHFLGVKSARMRVQLARVSPGGATGSYWPLVASSSPRPTHHLHQLLGYSPHLFCLSKLNVCPPHELAESLFIYHLANYQDPLTSTHQLRPRGSQRQHSGPLSTQLA